MAVTKTGSTAVKVYNPYAMFITPFSDANTRGAKTYQMEDIIRDSTSVNQDDAEENRIENEYGSAPIANNVKSGSFTFTTQIADMQKDLLKDICGFTVDETSGIAYAPATYKEVFAEIALVFQAGSKYYAAILPKVQLNPKTIFESFSSSIGNVTINGIGYNLEYTDPESSTEYTTPFVFDPDYTLPV